MHALFARLGRFVERRPRAVLFATVVLVALGAIGAAGTEIVTSQEILVSKDSAAFQEYKAYGETFGGDPLMVLIEGSPDELTAPGTITALRSLHDRFAKDPSIRSVVSPLTLLQTVKLPAGASLDTPTVAKQIVFAADGTVNAQFSSLMPAGHEVMLVRLAGNLSVDEEKATTKRVMDAVADSALPGDPIVAGNTRLISDITSSITKDMALTGGIAVLLMVVVLYIVFPVRRRLLALPVVLVGVLLTFGLTGAIGLSLTLVTMAGLPVLIGLGMDFAIQFHNRYEEESAAGEHPSDGIIQALTHVGPAVSTAVLATILGFVTLLMSAVPAVRDFGILLAIGVAVLFFVSLIALNTLLYRLDRGRESTAGANATLDATATAGANTAAGARGTADNSGGKGGKSPGKAAPAADKDDRAKNATGNTTDTAGKTTALGRGIPAVLGWLANTSIRFAPVVVVIGVLLAAGGFATDHKLPVQTDIEKLVPSDTPGVRAMNDARAVLGSATSISIMVEAPDVTSEATLTWLTRFQARILAKHRDKIIGADSLVTTLKLDQSSAAAVPAEQRAAALSAALTALPRDVRIGLVTDDHTAASINFKTKHLSIAELDTLIQQIKNEADAPQGIRLSAGGTVALGAAAISAITDRRTTIALIGFAAVLIGLLVVYRNVRRALLPVIPIILVTGWSSGVMWLFGIELNPLTAVMSALIIGVGTEFTVLLLERFWEELGRGTTRHEAMRKAVSRVGRSITASALTVAAGFGALIASSFPALREFATVTVIDVLLALFATLVIVPPLAMWLTPRPKTIV